MQLPLLQVKNLNIHLRGSSAEALVQKLSFHIEHGEVLGIVGESGAGKSLCAQAVIGLLPSQIGAEGSIFFKQQDLLSLSDKELHLKRGKEIGMIVQNPGSALNPLLKIGTQLAEGLRYHFSLSKKESVSQSVEWLRSVGFSDPEKKMSLFPHELSGGMKQRVLLAMAFSCRPDLIIADEPTTALDVTTQQEVLLLMQSLTKKWKTSVLLITHDFGVASHLCDRLLVLHKGKKIEEGATNKILHAPLDAYTKKLIQAKWRIDNNF